jgi:hypothetical protein
MEATTDNPEAPITKEVIVDLRRRVLANLPVSDEELAAALRHMCRSTPDDIGEGKKKSAVPKVKIDVMGLLRQRLAAKETPGE